MEKNEIKKALYKEKPTAVKLSEFEGHWLYKTVLGNGETIQFSVPITEMGENEFEDQLPAQLLIRWIYKSGL
jgi:hypothetical protein